MKVLGAKAVILTSREMNRKFGERLDYVTDPENKTVYIDRNLVDNEVKRFDGHLTIEDAVKDIYRRIREKEDKKSLYESLRDTIPRSQMKK